MPKCADMGKKFQVTCEKTVRTIHIFFKKAQY